MNPRHLGTLLNHNLNLSETPTATTKHKVCVWLSNHSRMASAGASAVSAQPLPVMLTSEGDASNWKHSSFFTKVSTFTLWSLLIPLCLFAAVPIAVYRKLRYDCCGKGTLFCTEGSSSLWHIFSIVFVKFTLDMARLHVLCPWYTMKLGCFLQARLNGCCRRRVLTVEKCATSTSAPPSSTAENAAEQSNSINSVGLFLSAVTYDVYRASGTKLEDAEVVVVHAVGGFRFCMPSRFYAWGIGSLVLGGGEGEGGRGGGGSGAVCWAMVRYTTTGGNQQACVDSEIQVKELHAVAADVRRRNPTAKIVFSGDSVGSNIVLCAAIDAVKNPTTTATSTTAIVPDGLMLHCPVYDSYHAPARPHANETRDFVSHAVFDLSKRLWHVGYQHGGGKRKDGSYESTHRHAAVDSKSFAVLQKMPVLVTLGERDLLVDVGRELFRDLQEQGVDATLHTAKKGVHNYMFLRGIDLTMATALTKKAEVADCHACIRQWVREKVVATS